MTWEEAKEAILDGFLITRPSWGRAAIGLAESNDSRIFVFFKDDSTLMSLPPFDNFECSYMLSQRLNSDFEIVEEL